MSDYLIWCVEKFIAENFENGCIRDIELCDFVTECIMNKTIQLDDSYSVENYLKGGKRCTIV